MLKMHVHFYIFSSLLPDFECIKDGSVYGNQYDPETGNCTCKPGWFGTKCQGNLPINISILKLIRNRKLISS